MDLPVDVHYAKMGEWIEDREAVLGKKWPKECLMLKTAAPTLVQRTKYEIPALKKAIQRWRTVGPEIDRQRGEGMRRAAVAAQQRSELLASVGLPMSLTTTLEVEAAIVKRTAVAAASFDRLAVRILGHDSLRAALEYVEAALQSGGPSHSEVDISAKVLFPSLWSQGCQDGSIAEDPPATEAEPAIDWGDDADGAVPTLDWGDDDGSAEPLANEQVVDLSIKREAAQSDQGSTPFRSLVQAGPMHSDRARAALAEEFDALRGFFVERILGAEDSGSQGTLPTNMDTSSMLKRLQTFVNGPLPSGVKNEVIAARCAVEVALLRAIDSANESLATAPEVKVLQLAASHQALERFLAQCDQLGFVANRASASTAAGDERKEEALAQLQHNEKQLEALVASTKGLQQECEAALRRMFAPREAFIVGDINNL